MRPVSLGQFNREGIQQVFNRLVEKITASLAAITTDITALQAAVVVLQAAVAALQAAVATLQGDVTDLQWFAPRQITLVAGDESTNLGTFTRLGSGIFNADSAPAGTTYTLKAACQVDSGQTYEVRVYDLTAGAYLAGTISDNNTSIEIKTLSLTLGAGERAYELRAQLTTGAGGADFVKIPSAFIEVSS